MTKGSTSLPRRFLDDQRLKIVSRRLRPGQGASEESRPQRRPVLDDKRVKVTSWRPRQVRHIDFSSSKWSPDVPWTPTWLPEASHACVLRPLAGRNVRTHGFKHFQVVTRRPLKPRLGFQRLPAHVSQDRLWGGTLGHIDLSTSKWPLDAP